MVKFFKRVIILCGKRTSIRMSEFEWQTLENISRTANMRRNRLIELIKNNKAKNLQLTPAIRLFIMLYLSSLQKADAETIDLLKLAGSLK